MRMRTRAWLHDERGVAGLMIVIVVAVIIGMLSFAIDGGGLFLKRRAMVNECMGRTAKATKVHQVKAAKTQKQAPPTTTGQSEK